MPSKDVAQPAILRCSFCNKNQNDVAKLIAGPEVFICDECVDVCNGILADDRLTQVRSLQAPARTGLPRPNGDQSRLKQWLSGAEGVEIDPELAAFVVACGRDAVIDLWFECESVITQLGASEQWASEQPLDLRTRIARLARIAQEFGLVRTAASFFGSDERDGPPRATT